MAKTCVKCGYERQPTDTAPDYECPKCGVIYAKAEAAMNARQVIPKPLPSKLKVDFAPTGPSVETAAPSQTIPPRKSYLLAGLSISIGCAAILLRLFAKEAQGSSYLVPFGGGLMFIVMGLIAAGWRPKAVKKKGPPLADLLADLWSSFQPIQQFVSGRYSFVPETLTFISTGIAINEVKNEFCLLTISEGSQGDSISHRIVPYKEVISVELFNDGQSIAKTDRSSQLGGAIVGGLLFGGVGAIIGGSSGDVKTSKAIDRIDLRITVNDTNAPLHDVSFRDTKAWRGKKIDVDTAMQNARHWQGIISVAMRQASDQVKDGGDATKQRSASTSDVEMPTSVADEIKKLADLHSSGSLSLSEFQQLKSKLLK